MSAAAVRALAKGLGISEAEAAARLGGGSPGGVRGFGPSPYPPPPENLSAGNDDGNPYERQLFKFLVRAYVELDRRLSLGNSILSAYLGECLDWAVGYRQWRQQNPFLYRWPTAPDLEREYQRALEATTSAALMPLRRAGVTDYALQIARPAAARVQLQQGGLFEFSPDGRTRGYVVPIRAASLDGPESDDPLGTTAQGQILDLVLFTPELNNGTWLRYGGADWLGNCRPQEEGGGPVHIHREPIDWLRSDCDGLVCLPIEPTEICRALSRFKAIDVDEAQAERFSGLYSLPLGRPKMRVVEARHAA